MTKDNVSYIQELKPTIWIGKNGCTEDIVDEMKRQLDTRKVIKVKWLQSSDMEKAEVEELAKMVSADVIDSRGKMVVFGAKNRGKDIQLDKTKTKKTTARDDNKRAYLVRK